MYIVTAFTLRQSAVRTVVSTVVDILILFNNGLNCNCDFFFFFNDTATTEIYTLSLHDALPILTHFKSNLVKHFIEVKNWI